ncbi:broad substrate specificity ATP-binding cassette transporter ABCG2-like isoform X2 [Watersipora subatra]|uniref:broad substrate specificity ATP-binding cassette transporter ABCG2-like isoform X2 n=1 Tax=Watersipora subatra TaxID=2589382 RepID=UPI00355BBCD2
MMEDSAGSERILPAGSLAQSDASFYKGSVVAFSNLGYTVDVSSGCCKSETKTILQNVSGVFKPGTMNAIMGPTGSGKSTLLDVLAERKNPAGLSGTVLIDGAPQPADFRLRSGYVVQDDIIMTTLTIRENLQFSADLRLSKRFSAEDKVNRVQEVINQLSLGNCADTRIGDEFTRGVSGGERKRCNIGMELIPSPGILFLDEPTTGLDASTAYSVMMLLKRLASLGSTIIFSIHQPRYSIFKLLDTLMLLGNGRTIYHGPAHEGIQFFQSVGYEIEPHDNPADFFLDVIIGSKLPTLPEQSPVTEDVIRLHLEEGDPVERSNQKCLELSQVFEKSQFSERMMQELAPYSNTLETLVYPDANEMALLTYHYGFFKQCAVLSRRTFLNLMRNPRTGLMQWMITIVFGAITGLFYFQVKDNCGAGIQDRIGAFFFVVMNQIFANLSAIDLFILERGIFIHENVSGYYRTSAYFFSKLFCDLLPYRTFPVILYGTIVYWMMGLVPKAAMFFIFLLTIVMTAWAATFMAFAASASTKQQAIANLIVALVYVFQMVFSGLLVNLKAAWFTGFKYISIFYYSIAALEINEFHNLNVTDFYKNVSNPETTEPFNW